MSEFRRIAVAGCGHVGAITAAGLTQLGHRVDGIDVDDGLVARLNAGDAPFREPGFETLLHDALSSGRLHFTTCFDPLADADCVFLCVSTPSTVTGAADLTNLRGALAEIAHVLGSCRRRVRLVNKSTVPLGTGDSIETILGRLLPADCPMPAIVANPEFLREGSAVQDFFHPDRIVVGAHEPEDARAVAALYGGIDAPVVLTDLRSAEMIKYVSNAFLATRVSFINEIARLCEATQVDVDEVIRGVGLDKRIGGHYLNPGIGYGGSCLPKDVAALCYSGDSAGVSMRLLSAVQETNLGQRTHAVNCLRRLLGGLDDRTIAVWGATFKGGTDDLRNSPAADIIKLLRNEGARVRLYDPAIWGPESEHADEVCCSALEAASGANAIALLADWPEFRDLDF
ncbi:MAG TPA: UDP-glucose/GDP-mannose dehydrogenase family protein, partial [Dehalococcoidia bacterium]|nr:UDP-glucose/GDP-mannose dehydrogenase family protein [Dehalococcoidia bacterium]